MNRQCASLNRQMPQSERNRFAAERALMAKHSIPQLIELLDSADLRTRFIAEMCLRDATNT